MADLTDNISIVARKIYSLLDENRVGLGFQDIWYGDQDKTPRTPCAAVESGPKTRELNGAPRRTMVTMTIYVLVYHEKILDVQQNQLESEKLNEAVEALLHQDAALDGLVIDSMVTNVEPGYVNRGGAKVKASRITFTCTSQKMLPYGAS